MSSLFLIRHGETDWNVAGRYQGQLDPPLNRRGLEQAAELASKLAAHALDLLYSSPLQRAAQTARIIASRLEIPLYLDARLMEIHQGAWQGRLRAEIERHYPDLFRRWEAEPWEASPPGGERLDQVQERVYQFVDEILRSYAGKRIGIVSHRIPIGLIKLRYQDLDPDIVRTLHLPNTYFEELDLPTLQPKDGPGA
jgi:broad specificity phosphatase PhoE